MKNQQKAYLYALLVILFWSTMGSAFKLSLAYLDYSNLLLFSSLISLLVLGIIITVRNNWKSVFASSLKDWMMSALLGFLNPFAYYVILFKAYSLIQAQEAVALNYTWPLVLVLLSIPLLKQRIGIVSILAILVSFSGALLVVSKGKLSFFSADNPFGSLLALSSSVIWAAYWILNMKDKRKEDTKLLMNFLFGFLYTLVYVFFFTGIILPGSRGSIGALYIGIFEMGITFFFWLTALQYSTTTARITKLVYISPFLSLILIHFLVGERINIYTLAGLSLIIGGIIWESLSRTKTDKKMNS